MYRKQSIMHHEQIACMKGWVVLRRTFHSKGVSEQHSVTRASHQKQ